MKSDVHRLINLLLEKKLTLALAESVTCGLAAHQLNIVKGTSEVLMGSIVCYNEKVKLGLMNIKPGLIKKFTAESQPVTDALARNLRQLIHADIYAAVTGLSSPGGSETKTKPVGTIFFSVLYQGTLNKKRRTFRGTPLEIKKKACKALYRQIIEVLEKG